MPKSNAVQLQSEIDRLQSRVSELEAQVTRLTTAARVHRQAKQQYELMLANINEVVYMLDPQGRFTYLSPSLSRFSQYTPAELIGRPVLELVHPDDQAYVQRCLLDTLSGHEVPREFRVVDKDGTLVEVRISSHVVRRRGKTKSVIGVLSSLTPQRAVERVLRESEQRLRIMAESLPMPIIITRLSDTRILAANTRVADLFGLPLSDLVGRPARDFFFSQREFRELVLQVHRTGQVHDCEVRACKVDGTVFWVASSILPIRFEGEAALVSGFYDLTERKQAEEALRRYAAELQIRNDELDAFAHTVAHDLKSPLSLILGYAELLLDRDEAEAAAIDQPYLRQIMQTVHKINSIIDELLMLSEVRKERVERQPLNMRQIVLEALARLNHLSVDSGATVTLATDWPVVIGHAPWVEEVWINYLTNGLKYGGRPPRLEVGYDRLSQQEIRFWVQDNGTGLTADDQQRLFTPFTQLAQVRATGHGLGLSIVRRIVEKLGGTVGVESTLGKGSKFYFTLPSAPMLDAD